MKEFQETDYNVWEFFSYYMGCEDFQVWSMTSKTKNVYGVDMGLEKCDYGKQVLV